MEYFNHTSILISTLPLVAALTLVVLSDTVCESHNQMYRKVFYYCYSIFIIVNAASCLIIMFGIYNFSFYVDYSSFLFAGIMSGFHFNRFRQKIFLALK